MSKQGSLLCTALLLSSAMTFAADNNDASMQSNDINTSASPAESTVIPTTPSTDTNSPSTSSPAQTPLTNEQGSQTGTESPNETNRSSVDVNATVTEVNNKVSIQGVTVAPAFTAAEFRDNVYYLPDSVNPVDGFYFLRIDSTDRVCGLQQITRVKILSTPLTITVMTGEQKKILYCYDRSYFNF